MTRGALRGPQNPPRSRNSKFRDSGLNSAPTGSRAAFAENRVALVIGQSNYCAAVALPGKS